MPSTPMPIQNGCNIPLNFQQGTVPNMGESIMDWFQALSFVPLTKTAIGYEVSEESTVTPFWGVFMPYSPRDLKLLPEGERAWTFLRLYAQPVLTLEVDDVVIFPQLGNKQTRVMSREDWGIYSYVTYVLCQDFTGSGPVIT